MKNKKIFSTVTCLVVLLLVGIFTSCKKEDTLNVRNNISSDVTTAIVSSQGNQIDEDFKGNNDRSACNQQPKPYEVYPQCITQLFNDPEYDFWDFSRIKRPHEFDTAGYHTFLISPKDEFMAGFNGLIITTERNPDSNLEEISQRYVMSFPLDCWDGFDPMWYYNHNELAYVEFLSYDYTELFYCGYWDVRNDRIELIRNSSGRGYWDYHTGGFHTTECLPLHGLFHRRDFNDCEYGLIVAQGIVDVGLFLASLASGTGPLVGAMLSTANRYAFDWMRKNVCH